MTFRNSTPLTNAPHVGTLPPYPLMRPRFGSISAVWMAGLWMVSGVASTAATASFEKEIKPLLTEYCNKCHSTEKQKGDLDLERFTTAESLKSDPHVWQLVQEQLDLGEMPPKEKPQLAAADRQKLVNWVHETLSEMARARAGDPGPVVLRRLSNAEYTYTIRDLTQVASLDPAREFPVDGAAGEGFTNTGAALVMSPALLSKYLDAAKDVARHAVLLPDGIRFSTHTSERDLTEETLAAIRAFYAKYTITGSGTALNLQGIKFDSNAGGVAPLEKYIAATLEERGAFTDGKKTVAAVAQERGLNAKYLGILWSTLSGSEASLVLDPLREQWRSAAAGGAPVIVNAITEWQKTLWRFTTVGHIGKRDGPKAWQEPVTPLAATREIRMKIPPPATGGDVTLVLATSDAGDGNTGDFAVWENPRLVAPGRPDLSLRDARAAVGAVKMYRERVFSSAAQCLAAVEEIASAPDKDAVARAAQKRGVEPVVLAAWLETLGIGASETRIESYITQKMEKGDKYDFIRGWTGADALSVLANSSNQHARIPGNMKPGGIAVHPSPKSRVLIGWRSPVAGSLRIDGAVQHAHPECGNGVTWALELRRGKTRQRLASGISHGAQVVPVGPIENLAVRNGDVISMVIGPRDGNHSCDLTAVDLKLSDGTRTWDLAKEIAPDIIAGNPHADGFGNPGVWHFYSEPDKGGGAETVLPPGSLLAKWQASANPGEKQRLAAALQELLLKGVAGMPKDSPDAAMVAQLTSLGGPLMSAIRNDLLKNAVDTARAGDGYGIDPEKFGRHPNGAKIDDRSLCVQAPARIEVRLPAELVEGCEFVATGTLHRETGGEGSIQMDVLASAASNPATADKTKPIRADSSIIVSDNSVARKRIENAFESFRRVFPAALCYTKIVPVDEVVTLTLFYREDEHFRRLMLDDAEAAELDRMWAELHYVSRDALKLVDAFEQLWQFATQDADPSAFEPLREPIKRRAAEFKKELLASEPSHLEGVLKFANTVWRRPLRASEGEGLRRLYAALREKEIPHEEALRLTLARVFVAPAFLYKMETPESGAAQGPVNDFELASRLSYFLWSSAPDAPLLADAASGRLRNPDVLLEHARRMIRDPRVRRLAVEFGTQWLHVRDFDKHDEKSERHFPTFASLRAAMNEEPVLFFTDFFQHDRPVLALLDADHTFVNGPLAQHYGLEGVKGEEWRRVDGVRAVGRGGVLGFAATLAKQSGASRTSPILRGNWLSETILGEKLPRPPKDVPVLPDEAPSGFTERQLTERHSSDEACARCHVRIDPFGFSLESFDAIGRFRKTDTAGLSINTHAKLADGTEFNGIDGLREYLLSKRRETFEKQFCKKLLGYALGRGVILSDQPLLEEILAALPKREHRIGAVLEMIVRSPQFREIRGLAHAQEP
jgi:hypothetical protein